MKNKISLFMLFFFLSAITYGQINNYRYQRTITGIKDQWHKIELPDEIFSKLKADFSDIRILGVSKDNDSLEVPYILKEGSEKVTTNKIEFNLLNQAKNDKGYFYTFEIPNETNVNQISLDFKERNFDWRMSLAGSQNQQEWFTILDDYRVLSIHNELTDYSFTKIIFPDTRYRFYRLYIDTKSKPNLLSSGILLNDTIQGQYRQHEKKRTVISEEKKSKQTIIDIELKMAVPVSLLTFFIKDTVDFYRPFTIQYLSDSTKTQDGWNYVYSTLQNGILNSFENNKFQLNSIVLKKLRLIIKNDDNRPLEIDSVKVEGYVFRLEARFDKPAQYFLSYGNDEVSMPNYDITRFDDKIPATMSLLVIGEEQMNDKSLATDSAPFFENKIWLWFIMTIIIIILGWFAFKMLQEK
jgi:hypothetical protein